MSETKNEIKRKLYADRDGFCTEASMLLMALAIVFRLIGSIGRWDDMNYLITQVALPIFGGLLFLLFLLLFSRRALWTTVIPVVLGIVFFIFRVMEMENDWLKVGYIALYLVIVVLYAMCFSHKNLKWALAALLLLVFAYHVVIEDLPLLMDLKHPVGFVDGMQELSVLAVLLSMIFIALAMKVTGGRKEKAPAAETPAAEPVPAEPAPVPEQVAAAEPVPALPVEEELPEPPAAEEPVKEEEN